LAVAAGTGRRRGVEEATENDEIKMRWRVKERGRRHR